VSYTNQTCSSISDLFTKLGTFLGGTPGWTIPAPAAATFAARKNAAGYDICFAAHWNSGSPNNVGIYQWYGAAYNSAVHASAQTDDSGNGVTTSTDATLDDARYAPITNTPIQFWCFEDDHYFHVVVETVADTYVHFGAGQLDKFNDWTGGEYVYGFKPPTAAGTQGTQGHATSILLDGLLQASGAPSLPTANAFAATIHAEQIYSGQSASEKWCVSMGDHAGSLGTDRAAFARRHWLGGYRAGPMAKAITMFRGSLGRGLCPMAPIVSFHWLRSPDELYGPMGQMKDVRMVNIRDFDGGEEITIASDVWVMFPSYKKSIDVNGDPDDGNSSAGESGYQGIAYKKVTT
jgi:hypothetical protein